MKLRNQTIRHLSLNVWVVRARMDLYALCIHGDRLWLSATTITCYLRIRRCIPGKQAIAFNVKRTIWKLRYYTTYAVMDDDDKMEKEINPNGIRWLVPLHGLSRHIPFYLAWRFQFYGGTTGAKVYQSIVLSLAASRKASSELLRLIYVRQWTYRFIYGENNIMKDVNHVDRCYILHWKQIKLYNLF